MEILIVVDVQNDFLEGGALEVRGGSRIIPVVNSLIERFSHVIYTQDWHPAGHKSFASSHRGKAVGDFIRLGTIDQYLWPDHCIQGSFGAKFHDKLLFRAGAKVFQKGMNENIDSYSAFYDN
ncbi:MAG: isochorismatase family protein, partial [Bacteroidia bacterium]|nr:isochorismatase family protein [Bacteroidia bacterium]